MDYYVSTSLESLIGQYVGGARVFRFKSCPKCKGDVILGNKDKHGWYEQCLQCGYLRDLEVIAKVEHQPAEEQKKMKLSNQKRAEGQIKFS
jgi:ssDNA-binding Zn-finger/Zn-ribbon topoisomerase 1